VSDAQVPRRGAGRFLLRLLVGVLLLSLIISGIGTPDFGVPLGPRLVGGIVAAALLLLLGQSVAALRWKVVLGPGSPRWGYLTRLYYVGGFFSLFLPTVVGGDVVRAAAAAQATRRPGGVIASVLIDRLLGVLALTGYGLLGLLLAPELVRGLFEAATLHLPAAGVLAGALAGLLALVLFVRRMLQLPRVRAAAMDGWRAFRDLARSPRTLVTAMLLGFVVQGLYILLWVVLAQAVRLPVEGRMLLLSVPVVSVFAMLPVTLNGLGVREGAWLLLLGATGIPDSRIVGFSLLFFITNLLTGLVGGVLFVARGTAER
jgi:uncharacterized membrane protein YbhN (UPF0104 family)